MKRKVAMRRDFEALRDGLKKALKEQGYPLDTYDPDFILGVIESECARLNIVVYAKGVKNIGDLNELAAYSFK